MHFDLIDLRLFINTLEAANITAGAERSHLSLAAASARIRAMEASLGTPLDVQERPSLQSVQDLRDGRADLAILSDAVDASGLQTLAFRDDPLVLIMPRHHPLTQTPSPDFIASLDHRHVCLGAKSALALHLDEQARCSARRLAVRVRAEGFDGLIRMVAHGAGVGIVPRAAAERCHGHLDFIIEPLSEPWAARKLVLCATDFASLPGYARGLVEVLQEQ